MQAWKPAPQIYLTFGGAGLELNLELREAVPVRLIERQICSELSMTWCTDNTSSLASPKCGVGAAYVGTMSTMKHGVFILRDTSEGSPGT